MSRSISPTSIVLLMTMILTGLFSCSGSNDRLAITAISADEPCGDSYINMTVIFVANPRYQFLVGNDISPKTNFYVREELATYIYSKYSYDESDTMKFQIEGFLTDRNHLKDCPGVYEFKIKKIRYGDDQVGLEF